MDSFFEPLGDGRFRATRHTVGPWDPGSQHGGPPSALLAHQLTAAAPDDDLMVARLTVELLGAVPVDEVSIQTRVARPGKRVQLLEASMTAGGREVARASAWRVARAPELGAAAPAGDPVPPPPLPEQASELVLGAWLDGYLSAVEWRIVHGAFSEAGPGAAWSRLLVDLVAGEEPSPLERVVAVADSANGLGSELDVASWVFINPELTVHVHREPVGEWILLAARTRLAAGGLGLVTSELSDQQGVVAVGAQSLLVAPR